MAAERPSTWRGGNGRNPEMIRPGLRNHFVYWLYSETGEVLYVGCTRHPEQRWRQHRRDNKKMSALVASKRMAGPYDYPTARRIEREQLDELNPRFDRSPRRRRPRSVAVGEVA